MTNNNNTANIRLTLAQDNADQTFELIQSLGILNAHRDGLTVTGTVADNLVNPLRQVDGVTNVEVMQPSAPPSAPQPQPAPSVVSGEAPTYKK
jgi:hypothetical protein